MKTMNHREGSLLGEHELREWGEWKGLMRGTEVTQRNFSLSEGGLRSEK